MIQRSTLHMDIKVPTIGHHKISTCISTTYLIRSPIFEGYVVWWGSKNKHQKDASLRRVNYVLTFFNNSKLNIQHYWRDLCD